MGKKDRLLEAFEYLRYIGVVKTFTDVAKAINASLSSVSAAMSGDERYMTDSFISRFASAYNIDERWLLTGDGESPSESHITPPPSQTESIPLSKRIKRLIEHSHMSVPKFSSYVGFKTPQTARELLKGNTKTISELVRIKIMSAFPEVNETWLVTGEGEMLREPSADEAEAVELQQNDSVPTLPDKTYKRVPIIHIDSVGGIHSSNDILTPEYIEGYIYLPEARDGDIAIYQSGNSMAPAIPSGALLQIREVADWHEYIGYGDVFVLLLKDDRRITKEIRKYEEDPDKYYWCVSYNPDVADERLPKSFVRRVFKVVKVLINRGW